MAPATATAICTHAHVDISLVLQRLTHEELVVGAWVNVMGYVEAVDSSSGDGNDVRVQAVLLWAAGPLDVQQYERGLAEMLVTAGDDGA